MARRSLRLVASAATTLTLVGAGLAVSTASTATAAPLARAAAVGDDPCPDAYDTTTLAPGQTVTGLTTTRGTTPEEFHGTYVGTIEDGIGKGLDLPIFDMEGSRITHTDDTVDAGIWAGMSGSPVYDDATGQLVGAVSYGFSSVPSRFAGVTPASYLYDLSNSKYQSTTTVNKTVTPSKAEARSIEKSSDTGDDLGTGHVLKPAKQVSGSSAARANANAAKSPMLRKNAPSKSGGFRSGGSSARSNSDYPITPGGNIATTFSTGDVTTASVGTVTAVCDDKVYAFGHPDEFTGKSVETFNGASAVNIQEDSGFGTSYKMANVGRVKGVINQDRVQGILGTLGQVPDSAVVTSSTTALGETTTSSTDVAVPYALSYVVATQVATDIVASLNQYSSGDALSTWTITYTRAGVPGTQTFKRTQRTSEDVEFPDFAAWEAASDVEALQSNGFEKVKISSVDITTSLLPDYRAFKATGAQYYRNGKWYTAGTAGIKTKPGSTTKIRLKLGPADVSTDIEPTTIETSIKTGKHARGTGRITLQGLATSYDEDDEFGESTIIICDEKGCEEEDSGPADLDELIALLKSTPRNDSLVSTLTYRTKHSKQESMRTLRTPGIARGTLKVPVTFTKN
jgi:hypothetical protein